MIFKDPSGNTPYTVELEAEYGFYKGTYYMYLVTSRGEDLSTIGIGVIPGGGLVDMGVKYFSGWREIDESKLEDPAKQLINVLNKISNSKAVNISTTVLGTLEAFKDAKQLPKVLRIGSKYIGKFATYAGYVISAWQLKQWFTEGAYVSQQLVDRICGPWLSATTIQGVQMKYIYAILRIKELVGNGKLTYTQDLLGNISDYSLDWEIELQIIKELKAIDEQRGENQDFMDDYYYWLED